MEDCMRSERPKQITRAFLIVVSFCSVSAFPQQQSETYDWPLKPGMVEWKQLNSHQKMLQALQIPAEKLHNMSLACLVKTCLKYPLFSDIWYFNSLQDGMTRVVAGFNGLQELLHRDDAGLELYKIYKTMNPHNFSQDWSDLQKGKYTVEFAKVEILLAQDGILASLMKGERTLLLRECLNKRKAMMQYSIYDRRNEEPNTYLMGKIIQKDSPLFITQIDQKDERIHTFLQRGSKASIETINIILFYVEKYLNND